jgi:hypothetical protein
LFAKYWLEQIMADEAENDFLSENDERSYAEKMFFNVEDGELTVKSAVRIDCSDGPPEALPDDKICILTNFKKNFSRGRKDPLRNRDVLAIPADKGTIFLPLDEVSDVAKFLYSFAASLKNS